MSARNPPDKRAPSPAADPLAALRYRNYRLYFVGQFVSQCGSWLQSVAQGWLVWQLTGNSFMVGVVTAAGTAPTFFFSLAGGHVADRVNRQKLVLVTQTLSMLLAALLGYLALQKRTDPHLLVLYIGLVAAALGVVNAFDMPARQAMVIGTVRREALMNAIALNSVMFNGARVFGPALAGLSIRYVGTAGCFFLNSISYLAAILAIGLMRFEPEERAPSEGTPLSESLAGIRYVSETPVIRRVVLLLTVVGVFGWPISVLFPAIATNVLHGKEAVYSWLVVAQGVGAVVGAVFLASQGDSPHRRALVYGGLAGMAAGLLLFSFARHVPLALIALGLAGATMIVYSATSNTVIQALVPDQLRGRVMAVWALVFAGTNPIGSLLEGSMAKFLGAPGAIRLSVGVLIAAGLIIFRQSYRERAREEAVAPLPERPAGTPRADTAAAD